MRWQRPDILDPFQHGIHEDRVPYVDVSYDGLVVYEGPNPATPTVGRRVQLGDQCVEVLRPGLEVGDIMRLTGESHEVG